MRALALSAFVLAPLPALADCAPGGHVFSCQIGTKVLELCQNGGSLTYAFGPRSAPELTLSEPLTTVDFTPWSGVGGMIWESVTFTNQSYGYEVWTAVDRQGAALEGGINVMQNGALVAQLSCAPGTASNSLDVIYGLKEAVNLCWSHDKHVWTAC